MTDLTPAQRAAFDVLAQAHADLVPVCRGQKSEFQRHLHPSVRTTATVNGRVVDALIQLGLATMTHLARGPKGERYALSTHGLEEAGLL